MKFNTRSVLRSVGVALLVMVCLPAQARSAQPSWQELLTFLPSLKPSAPPSQPLDITLEGDTARFYIEALMASTPSAASKGPQGKVIDVLMHEILPKLKRARLKGTNKSLVVQALFDDAPVDTDFTKRDEAKNLSLYGLVVPHYIRFKLTYQDPYLTLENMEETEHSIALKVKIPVISDLVYLHWIQVNPTDGSVLAQAGVVGDDVSVYAKARIYDKAFDGVDLWDTFLWNYRMFVFPVWESSWWIF